jgi:hypothetical protein
MDVAFAQTSKAFDQYLAEYVQVNPGHNPSYYPEDGILFDSKSYLDDPNADNDLWEEMQKQYK